MGYAVGAAVGTVAVVGTVLFFGWPTMPACPFVGCEGGHSSAALHAGRMLRSFFGRRIGWLVRPLCVELLVRERVFSV